MQTDSGTLVTLCDNGDMYAADEQTKQRLLLAVRQAAGSARGNSVTAEDILQAATAGIADTESLEKANRHLDLVRAPDPHPAMIDPGSAMAAMAAMARAA